MAMHRRLPKTLIIVLQKAAPTATNITGAPALRRLHICHVTREVQHLPEPQ
jgi:hypothetical protein